MRNQTCDCPVLPVGHNRSVNSVVEKILHIRRVKQSKYNGTDSMMNDFQGV
jgi:hypothetical protein